MGRQPDLDEGEVFEGPSRTLTDAHFLFFSALTGDLHPIHYDVEYAKGTRYGKPLAHGLHLASLTALGASNARERLHGLLFVEQGCRFLRPAIVGDTIRPTFELERAWQDGARRYYRFKTALINQAGQILLEGYQVYQAVEHAQEGTK